MIELSPKSFLLGTLSAVLGFYPAFLRASLLLQRFVQ
jgi:hypothetical protein